MKAFIVLCALAAVNANEVAVETVHLAQHLDHLPLAHGLHHHDVGYKQGPPVPFERGPLECSCPDTYQLVGQRCERIIRYPLETLCPAGYDQTDAATCIKQVLPEERCPFGFARVKGDCIKRDITVPQLGCNENYTLESTASWSSKRGGDHLLCVSRYPVATELECPDGTAASGQCLTPVAGPASYTCPPGFSPTGTNLCNKVTDVDCATQKKAHPPLRKLHAEETYDLVHNLHDGLSSAVHNGVHTGLRNDLNIPSSAAVFTDIDTLRSPAVQSRPLGTYRDNILYNSIHSGDLGAIPAAAALAAGGYGTAESNLRAGRLYDDVLVGGRNAHAAIGYHKWHSDHHLVQGPAPAVSISEQCTANITIEATPYCPTGELRGQLCIQMEPTAAVEVCPAFGTVDNCYAYDRQNPISTCPEGYTQECAVRGSLLRNTVDCECVQTTQTGVEVLCPPGSTYVDGLCQFTTAPYTGCPIGSQLVNGACEELEIKPCACTYTVNFACQGPSCASHGYVHGHGHSDAHALHHH